MSSRQPGKAEFPRLVAFLEGKQVSSFRFQVSSLISDGSQLET
jgi:hypothetical protein